MIQKKIIIIEGILHKMILNNTAHDVDIIDFSVLHFSCWTVKKKTQDTSKIIKT